MITINSFSDKYFTMDGINYARIYQPLTQGTEDISIVNIYDTRQKLVNSTHYSEFTVNSQTYNNQADLVAALLEVIWSKPVTGSTVGSIAFQTFYAAEHQWFFEVTEFEVSDNYKVFTNGSLQVFGHSRYEDTIIFSQEITESTEIVIMQ